METTVLMDTQSEIPRFSFPTIPKLEVPRPNKFRNIIDYTDPKIQKIIEYDQLDTKTKNRISAKKWRDSKINHIFNLEDANYSIRAQCLGLLDQMTCLITENEVIGEEIELIKLCLTKIQEFKN
ncbi:hypothetical protein TVAG_507500 [Trichomonas vaginalis G3]|uniref:Uncharacterized protein n=1 Tax=Trichomonas vaginalis (strain ATCC PRA-98 / G3) TaxID=412133 RepID=A2GJY7_TRIV3|nr:leucine zipper domain family [Trichomonas vaginalis G3]EAX82530.1 hypothetical protein TVAG_507500 [Trichomonas vaginalis G3]KAI5501385.1 leucine zipper domain family [Trichomonas vaginalis G3]|eukprot:XP_001295460.1 hypothetical protein [Trichomonas vaginalis G3]